MINICCIKINYHIISTSKSSCISLFTTFNELLQTNTVAFNGKRLITFQRLLVKTIIYTISSITLSENPIIIYV